MWRTGSIGRTSERRGTNALDLARNEQMDEMRGKSALDFARNGQVGEMRGKSALDSGPNGETPLSRSPQYKTGTCRSYALYFAFFLGQKKA
ncbi:hypothetical protein BK144_29400, partial [Paenibacillus sp. FSL R7-0273]